jgi:hypothetical protein
MLHIIRVFRFLINFMQKTKIHEYIFEKLYIFEQKNHHQVLVL